MTKTRMTWAVMAALASGCGASELDPRAAEVASTHQALLQENGRELNGRELNGSSLGGATAQGLSALWLEGSELVARTESGAQVRGAALVGAQLASEGSPLRYRVDGVEAVGDVWHYRVSYLAGGRWQQVCEDGVTSIPLAGRWDYRQGVEGGGSRVDVPGVFTFACTDAALGKCVLMGYAPWRAAAGGGSLAAHHQACTRMLRADYEGDGRSFTKDGVTINVYDGVGIQQDTEHWHFEAEWDEEGALCLEGRRRTGRHWKLAQFRDAEWESVDCGDKAHFGEGTLLMTEYRAR